MKNTLNISISALTVSMFIVTAPLAQGMRSIAPWEKPERTEIMPAIIVRQKPMMLAENEKDTAGQKAPTASSTNGPASEAESGPETNNKEPSIKSKSTPLKPFKPSEEIAAEQAVDFPVDI